MFGHRWGEASRWWGTVEESRKGVYREMEFDVMAESTDGNALLVGECKWTNPECAAELYRKMLEKATLLPVSRGKEIIPVLFLKNLPKDDYSGMNIMFPQNVIDAMYAE